MSYWLEDADGNYLGDLATNVGINQLREAGSPALTAFLDAGEADDDLLMDVVAASRGNPKLRYLVPMLDGAKAPVYVTDGCGHANDATENYDPDQARDEKGQWTLSGWTSSGNTPHNHEGKHEVDGIKYDSADGLGQTGDNMNIEYMGHVSYMTPGQFLRLNPDRVQGSSEFIDQAVAEGKPVGPPMLYGDYDEATGTTTVTGHEGRGRAMAVQKLDPKTQMPVHVILRKKGTKGSDAEMRSRKLAPDIAGSLILPDKRSDREDKESFQPHRVVIQGKEYRRGKATENQVKHYLDGHANHARYEEIGRQVQQFEADHKAQLAADKRSLDTTDKPTLADRLSQVLNQDQPKGNARLSDNELHQILYHKKERTSQ